MSNVVNAGVAGAVLRRASTSRPAARKSPSEWLLLLGLATLFATAWAVSEALPHVPGSDLDYYLGLTGALMMLALFLYPLRKRLRFMRAAGAVKYWFASHMTLGICGPLVILVHSRFQAESLNAAVALSCMLIVMLSGVVGRFIYRHIHHGLYGQRATLEEMQAFLRLNTAKVHSKLAFAPAAERQLLAFERVALAPHKGVIGSAWSLMTLWLRGRLAYRRCYRCVARALAELSIRRGLKAEDRRRYRGAVAETLRSYIQNVQRVAHFSIYERLFALWHVLHIPFVYMLVASVIAHVVAVHMY
jgi:hypothetical protein